MTFQDIELNKIPLDYHQLCTNTRTYININSLQRDPSISLPFHRRNSPQRETTLESATCKQCHVKADNNHNVPRCTIPGVSNQLLTIHWEYSREKPFGSCTAICKVFILKSLGGVSGTSAAIHKSFLQQNFAFAKSLFLRNFLHTWYAITKSPRADHALFGRSWAPTITHPMRTVSLTTVHS